MERPFDERLVHRLEAFSDIVIAFSLSEIAFNLQIPMRAADIFAQPFHLVGFIAGFAFVANIWWLHSRIFSRFFIPDSVGIVANFVLLAATVLFAWAQQLFYKFGLDQNTAVLYAVTGGVVYALIGLLFVRGARDARLNLTDAERRAGSQRSVRALIIGCVLLGSLTLLPFGFEPVAYSWFSIFPAAAIARFMQRRHLQRSA